MDIWSELKYPIFIKRLSDAILIYENATTETLRDSSNSDLGHIQLSFLETLLCAAFIVVDKGIFGQN